MTARTKHWTAVTALVIVTILTFARTYYNEFLGIDDHVYIWDNPHIRDGLTWEGVRWAFQAGLTDLRGFADYWQPMTFLSRMIDISLFNFKAGMHHLTNLVLHCANIVLLYWLLWKVSRQTFLSFFVTALFAVHPLQAEILGWVTARKDVLSLFFGLMTMHAYLWTKVKSSVGTTALLVLCFALSLMSKPMMITLPILLLLIDAWQKETDQVPWSWREWKSLVLNKWPLFLMIILYLPIPFRGQPQALEFDLNPPMIRGLVGYMFYIGKLIYPFDLSLYGPVPEKIIPMSNVIMSVIGLCALTGMLYWFSRRNKVIFIGWLWFLIACVPIVSLPVADRFMYMPMIGFWIMVLSLLLLIPAFKRKTFLSAILVCVLLAFCVKSFKQISVWKNNETVLHRALEFSNDNYAAHNVLGAVYGKRKEFDRAMTHLKEAIRIKPDRDKPYNNIGLIHEMQGRPDKALEYYERSLSLNPDDFRTISNMGIIYIRQGNIKKGIEFFERAIAISPKMKGLQNNLAIAYYKEGNIEKAEELAEKFKSPYAFNQFGIFKVTEQDYPSARHYFNEALAIDPSYDEARKNLKLLEKIP